MGQRLTVVDAFTDRPFAGNPAAVCVLERPAEEAWMRLVAREMNLSETAFLWPEADGHRLRWFTPTDEVSLCGHATLASAHVLWTELGRDGSRPLRFHTRSGLLTATRAAGEIVLDFPAQPATACAPAAGLLAALGLSAESVRHVGRSELDYLVELSDERELRALAPDFGKLAAVDARGVTVTAAAAAGSGYDCVSRFFGPRVGVDEDPVTGSAHCAVGPYWGARLGKSRLRAFQASARGGSMTIELAGDRVRLIGKAVTMLRAELAS